MICIVGVAKAYAHHSLTFPFIDRPIAYLCYKLLGEISVMLFVSLGASALVFYTVALQVPYPSPLSKTSLVPNDVLLFQSQFGFDCGHLKAMK